MSEEARQRRQARKRAQTSMPEETGLATRDPGFVVPANSPGALGPDWLCIGAQKSGTTWLNYNLRFHPNLWLPPIKEVAYFSELYLPDTAEDDRQHRARQIEKLRARAPDRPASPALRHLGATPVDDDWYRRIFAHRQPDQSGGEISPQYATLPRIGIRHVLAMNPHIRIIALLRDPVERALSAAKVRAGEDAGSAAVLAKLRGPHWDRAYRFGDYAQWLARWRGMLPPGQLHVDTMDRIGGDPSDVLRGVCGFLGVPFRAELFPELGGRQFASPRTDDPLSEARAELARRMAPIYTALEAEMPDIATLLRRPGGTPQAAPPEGEPT